MEGHQAQDQVIIDFFRAEEEVLGVQENQILYLMMVMEELEGIK